MLIQRNRPRAPLKPRQWPADKPKPKLAMIHLPHFRVHYTALEAFLGQVYGMRDFDYLFATGCVPGLVAEYTVVAEMPPGHDARVRADKIRCGLRTKDVSLILAVLCVDGFIPQGRYQIDTKPLRPLIDVYRDLLEETRDPNHPECVKFRKFHKRDAEFTTKANVLDKALFDYLRSVEQAA